MSTLSFSEKILVVLQYQKAKVPRKAKQKNQGMVFYTGCFLDGGYGSLSWFFGLFFFIPMAILRLLRRKKTKTNSTSKETSVETTVNRIEYRTLYIVEITDMYGRW